MKVITRITTVTGTDTHFLTLHYFYTNLPNYQFYQIIIPKMNSLYWQSYSGCRGCSLVLNSVNIGKHIFLSIILKLELRTFKRWEKPPFYVWYKFGQNKANGLALDEQKIRKALDSGLIFRELYTKSSMTVRLIFHEVSWNKLRLFIIGYIFVINECDIKCVEFDIFYLRYFKHGNKGTFGA